MKPVKVLLADDHTLLRSGVRALLERMACVEVVGEASTGREAIERARTLQPELILLDITMPDLGGLEALPRLRRDFPEIKIMMLSAHANEEYVIRALRAGAAGYLLKDAANRGARAGDQNRGRGQDLSQPFHLAPGHDSYLERVGEMEGPLDQLTPRQREILQGIAEGRSTKEIAHDLGISAKTVETHRAQLMERLEIREVAGLVRYAIPLRADFLGAVNAFTCRGVGLRAVFSLSAGNASSAGRHVRPESRREPPLQPEADASLQHRPEVEVARMQTARLLRQQLHRHLHLLQRGGKAVGLEGGLRSRFLGGDAEGCLKVRRGEARRSFSTPATCGRRQG